MNFLRRLLLSLGLALGLALASQAAPVGPQALASRALALAPQLENSPFGEPLLLMSEERAGRIDGEVFAILPYDFELVASALSEPGRWCGILILHLNTKACHAVTQGPDPRLELRVGRKEAQDPGQASPLTLHWHAPVRSADYLGILMDAPEGPYDTRDYQLTVEAIPLDGKRSFIHMGYALSHGGMSSMAMKLYLATVGRGKVGFSAVQGADGRQHYVGGMRGVVERNTMRYFLALRAYLDSLSLPPEARQQARMQAWFDATEKYPRQLHEVSREDYLRTKREEVAREAGRAPAVVE